MPALLVKCCELSIMSLTKRGGKTTVKGSENKDRVFHTVKFDWCLSIIQTRGRCDDPKQLNFMRVGVSVANELFPRNKQ